MKLAELIWPLLRTNFSSNVNLPKVLINYKKYNITFVLQTVFFFVPFPGPVSLLFRKVLIDVLMSSASTFALLEKLNLVLECFDEIE